MEQTTLDLIPLHVRMPLQDALMNLEMPRFTRRYPVVLETLMKQMLQMVYVSIHTRMGVAAQ